MVEIYKEKVFDLLKPGDELKIRESSDGFFIQGVEKKIVLNANEMINYYKEGCKNRTTAATTMNAHSSRSHMALMLGVSKYDKIAEKKKMSVFNLIDLAGSEKFNVSEDVEETKKINLSLTQLGLVIRRLVDQINKKIKSDCPIPYRESVLTKILKQSLGGNCKTSVILCCSPANCNKDETINTLRFGENCKRIKNNVKQNIENSVSEYKAEINRLRSEILMLETQITGGKIDDKEKETMINVYIYS